MKRLLLFSFVFIASISIHAQNIVTSDTTVTYDFPSWRFSVQGGYAYRVGNIDKSQDAIMVDHIKKLKHGVTYGTDATWFFMESFGVGIKYNDLYAGNREYITVTYDGGTQQSGFLEDKIHISFFGPIASYRVLSRDMRNALFINIGLGYLGYKNHAVFIVPLMMKGGTLGELYEFGYDLKLTDKISLGGMLSIVSGVLTSYKINSDRYWETINLETDSYESLNHINLSVGVRINL